MLDYYARKLRNTLLTRYATQLGDRQTGLGLLSGAIGNFQFQRRFVFYFADTQYVHLGDQLFHQPLLTHLHRNGYDVRIAASAPLAPYFTGQGLRLLSPGEYSKAEGAVVITKNDLARSIAEQFPRGNFFVGVNYHLVAYPGPIMVGLTRAVYSALERLHLDLPPLPSERDDLYQPYVPPIVDANAGETSWRERIATDEHKHGIGRGYLVYNDYVSSAYLEAKLREPVIRGQGCRLKSEGFRLIYTGTQAERQSRPEAPEFIDLDLRGELNTMDLFELFRLTSVRGVICYDTFVMHVASALRKDLYVTLKKRGRDWQAYKQRYVPMFPGAEEIVKECL